MNNLRFFAPLLFLIPYLLVAQLPDMIPYKKGNLWGYADSMGRIILEPQWSSATPFDSNGLAQVGIEYEYRYRYKRSNIFKDKWDIETCSYKSVINKKGEFLIPHNRIAEIMLRCNKYGFNCVYMSIKDSLISLNINEAGIIQFDLKGKLLFISTDMELTAINTLNSYAYTFNRQVIRVKNGIQFIDRFQNPKSRVYQELYDEYRCFSNYYLFKIIGIDGKDSIIINPDGPAALVKDKKYWMFVDTSDQILYKWKDNEEWPDIQDYFHPKDSLHYSVMPQNIIKPCPAPYYNCVYPYNRFDTSKTIFANWYSKGVLPAIYDLEHLSTQDLKLPYMRVKSDSFFSYMDTFGNLLMPFKYKKLTHYRTYYSLAFDTAWHWIDINGNLLSDNYYKSVRISGYAGVHYVAEDTALHWIDCCGKIIYDNYYRKGYQIVPFTGISLFYDPKRDLYIDKYGREYGE